MIGQHRYFGDASVFSIDDVVILEDTVDGAVKKRAMQEAISIVFECLPSNIIVINNVLAEKMFTRQQLAALKFELLPDQFQYYMHKDNYHGVALKAIQYKKKDVHAARPSFLTIQDGERRVRHT